MPRETKGRLKEDVKRLLAERLGGMKRRLIGFTVAPYLVVIEPPEVEEQLPE